MLAIRERRTGHRASKYDPTYEEHIQEALEGVLSGKYLNYTEAAKDVNVRFFSDLFIVIFLRVFSSGHANYTQRSCP